MKKQGNFVSNIIAEFSNGMTLEIPWDGKSNRFMVFQRECKRLGIEPFAILR